jgi:hypothetical protein
MRVEGIEHFDHIRRRDFAAQVQKMFGTQQLTLGQTRERLRALRLQIAVVHVHVRTRTNSERIEHGGNACGSHLRIVNHKRRVDMPPHARARCEMLLKIVRVQFDQPR